MQATAPEQTFAPAPLSDAAITITRPQLEAVLAASHTPPAPAGVAEIWSDLQATASASTPPAIGSTWPGQGGIFVGWARGENGAPDAALIMAPDLSDKLTWSDAVARAQTVTADGHSDFHLPTRFESALIYACARDAVDIKYWYWTSTQYSDGFAWSQGFDDGYQDNYDKFSKGRARAVRRFIP